MKISKKQKHVKKFLKKLKEYYGGVYYIVGDGCPPRTMDNEIDLLIKSVDEDWDYWFIYHDDLKRHFKEE